MQPLQAGGLDPQALVPPLVDAALRLAPFIIAFIVIYVLGRSIATRAVERSLRHQEVEEPPSVSRRV